MPTNNIDYLKKKHLFIPVILSGGKGSRLWPISRDMHPKQFIKLKNKLSLLQNSFLRAAYLASVSNIVVVTNKECLFKTKEEYSDLKLEKMNCSFLVEPVARNTLAAITLAALSISTFHDEESIILVMPADHLIEELSAFETDAAHAYELAKKEYLTAFGIVPRSPETGYGYIEYGNSLDELTSSYQILRFKEKPDLETAKQYVASGRYLWNSGLLCFKANVFLNKMKQHSPKNYEYALSCWEKTYKVYSHSEIINIDESFSKLEDISVDHAIMEKIDDAVVITSHFDWNDVGSWKSLSKLTVPDEQGNGVVGETILLDVNNSYIQSENKLIAAIGITNLLIIDTPDALLVADRDRSQDVKKIVSQLKCLDHDSYKLHKTVSRPWGTYTVLEEGENFKIKRIVVKPGAMLSLQIHHYRSEHWVVVSGIAGFINGDKKFFLKKNESTYIPAGSSHRLENPGLTDLVIIEVQSGEYVGEDDIIRLEDKYGRVDSIKTF